MNDENGNHNIWYKSLTNPFSGKNEPKTNKMDGISFKKLGRVSMCNFMLVYSI